MKDAIIVRKVTAYLVMKGRIGEKEMKCVKESAKLFQQMHPNCTLYEAKGYNHGYLSTYLPLEWMELVTPFLERNE